MLVDLTVKEFLNKVAGSDPVPGGGSIAALNGAIASALAAMAVSYTHLDVYKRQLQTVCSGTAKSMHSLCSEKSLLFTLLQYWLLYTSCRSSCC